MRLRLFTLLSHLSTKVSPRACGIGAPLPFFATIQCRELNLKGKTMTNPENYKDATSIYDFTADDIKGESVSLEKYRGHVCIIVNVASQCGYTKNNYAELVQLHEEYSESKGLRILAFPCNQFGGQEPGDPDTICSFVAKKNVKFDMFDKIDVNGSHAHPLWNYLKHKQGGTLGNFIKWNFTKFIIDKNGQPVERHGPNTNPKDLVKSLEKLW